MNNNKVYLEAPVIINAVAEYFRIPPEDITTTRRYLEYIRAKHITMYCFRQFTNLSQRKISNMFNLKNHSTVNHAIHSVENQMNIYPGYRNQLNEILNKLKKIIEKIIEEAAAAEAANEINNKYKNYDTEKV